MTMHEQLYQKKLSAYYIQCSNLSQSVYLVCSFHFLQTRCSRNMIKLSFYLALLLPFHKLFHNSFHFLNKKPISISFLTHSFPMHPFSTPCKHQKTVRFSDVFKGQRKSALGTNALMKKIISKTILYNIINQSIYRMAVKYDAEKSTLILKEQQLKILLYVQQS